MEHPMDIAETARPDLEPMQQEIKREVEETVIAKTPPETFPDEENKENGISNEETKILEEKKEDLPKTGLKIRITVPKKEAPQCKEGTNIHFTSDGRRLCSFSGKLCYQKRLDNFGFCIRHILEDPQAPFQQCQFISKQKNKQCTNPVSVVHKDEDSIYCMSHKQALGLSRRSVNQKKAKKQKQDAVIQETKAQNSKKFLEALNSEGIVHSQNMQKIKSVNAEGLDYSSSSASEDSSDDDSEESSDGSEDFVSTMFMEELQRQEEEEPDYLRDTNILTEEEVILRRKQKIKKLIKLYKLQFYRLKDILSTKHRKFMKKKQMLEKRTRESKRMLKDPDARKQQKQLQQYHPLKNAENQVKFISKEKKRRRSNDERKGQKTCTFERCKGKCMPLTDYCYAHILKDPDQKLFTNCMYTSPTGVSCNYPILVGQTPPFCNGHIDLVGNKEPNKPPPRKRKVVGDEEKPVVEVKKKKEEPKMPSTKVSEALAKRVQAKKSMMTEKPMMPPPPTAQSYFQTMQQPVFLPHLLGRGSVPTAVPMPQYLNPRLFMQEGMRKMDGKDGDMQMNPLAAMSARPEAFMHPTFFYHPGLLFPNQPMKMPTPPSEPPSEDKKN